MKNVVIALSLLMAFSFISCKEKASDKVKSDNVDVAAARDADAQKVPVMTFEKSEHDFGTIANGAPQETTFKFTNTGSAPLIITNATSSCGCTVPEYPKNTPIAPGESGELLVKFNGSGLNQVTKTVTVSANTEKGTELLRIKAFIQPKADAQANVVGPVPTQ